MLLCIVITMQSNIAYNNTVSVKQTTEWQSVAGKHCNYAVNPGTIATSKNRFALLVVDDDTVANPEENEEVTSPSVAARPQVGQQLDWY
jgi:hypothetical protein